jgi:molybdopterin synthase sulfur carrier subunit
VAEDTRRVAGGGLRAQCTLRGSLGRVTADIVAEGEFDFLSIKIAVVAQVASDRDKEEMTMAVTFHIPGALREFTAGRSQVEIEHPATTLADALSALWSLYPGVRDRIATEQEQVREHINIFIGDENIRYTGGLASPLSPGSEISIVPAVSGG